jgi:magnesium transporter
MLTDMGQRTMIQLRALRREFIAMRRAVWPMRDALAQVVRYEEDRFTPGTEVFLRDLVSGAVDLQLSMTAMPTLAGGMVFYFRKKRWM